MDEQFVIEYNGKKVNVRIHPDFIGNPVYFVDLPGKTLSIEMSEDGFWKECEGETTEEIQELGQLIEEYDY